MENLKLFVLFFTVNFDLILSPNQSFLWCRSTVGTSTQTHAVKTEEIVIM